MLVERKVCLITFNRDADHAWRRTSYLVRTLSSAVIKSTGLYAVIMNNEKHESWFKNMRQKRSTPAGRLTFVGLRGAEYVFHPHTLTVKTYSNPACAAPSSNTGSSHSGGLSFSTNSTTPSSLRSLLLVQDTTALHRSRCSSLRSRVVPH
jgi:hypothetical protein